MKTYTIDDQGNVTECSKFLHPDIQVKANTKTEATQKLLARLARISHFQPVLYFRNGAYCLVTPSIHEDSQYFVSESGTVDSTWANGKPRGMCISGGATEEKALAASSFDYYASAEYRACLVPSTNVAA